MAVISTTKKKPVRRSIPLGLLAAAGYTEPQQQERGNAGLLGQQDTMGGLLAQNMAQSQYGGNSQESALLRQQAMQEARQQYINGVMAQQDDAEQKKMEQGAAKQAARYGNSISASGQYSDIGPAHGSSLGSSDAATSYKVDMSGADTGTEGVSYGDEAASGDSGGSWTGAVGGALAGYGAGKKNYYKDPAMRDQKDGFGKYHRDYRAEIGGGTLGGVMGYFSDGYATPFVSSVVDWFHPYAQDMTRSMINWGDQAGGAYGALMADPIGTWASGKYHDSQLVASGLTPLLAPFVGGKAPEIADKASGTIADIGRKIADVFGW